MIMTPTSAQPRRKFDSLEQAAYLHLWRTYDRLRAIEDELFERHGLSAQQYNALRLLAAAQPVPIPTLTLGARLISRAPDMTRLLDRLEERGWVTRQRRSDNRRVVEVAITTAGSKLLDRLEREVRDCHHRQLGHLDQKTLRALIELLSDARAPHEDAEHPWPNTKL